MRRKCAVIVCCKRGESHFICLDGMRAFCQRVTLLEKVKMGLGNRLTYYV